MNFNWEDQPEALGPITEPAASGQAALDLQALHQHSIRLPQLAPGALERGDYVPVSRIEPQLDPATRDRERAEAARLYERRQAIERAAIAAGYATLTGGAEAADKLLKEAAQIAEKAAVQP